MAMRLMYSKLADPLYEIKRRHIKKLFFSKHPSSTKAAIKRTMQKYHPEINGTVYLDEIQQNVDKITIKIQQYTNSLF